LQPDRLTMVLEYSNLFFSVLFAVEMLLKIVSDGPFGYIRDGFNVFDGFIVVLRSVCLSVCLSVCPMHLAQKRCILFNG